MPHLSITIKERKRKKTEKQSLTRKNEPDKELVIFAGYNEKVLNCKSRRNH